MLNIVPYDWGIASRVGNDVYINEDIFNDEELLEAIMVHEGLHTETLTWDDMMIDLNGEGLQNVKGRYWNFVLTHPKSWVQFIPIWKFPQNPWTIDWFMALFWIFAGGITWSLIKML